MCIGRRESIMATSPLIEAVVANNIGECRRLLETEEGMETIDDRDQNEEEFHRNRLSRDHIYRDRPTGLTALMHACKDGYLNIAELLLSKGAVVDRRDIKERYTALMMASRHNHFEIAKLLIFEVGGAEVDLGDEHGWTALHYTSIEGNLEISELLTSSGADVNIRSKYGFTALHRASYYGRLEIVQLLLCQGADMSIRDNDGDTALDLASYNDHLKVANCLRKWPWTMAIIALKEDLAVYHLLDAWTLIDLWQYLGTQ